MTPCRMANQARERRSRSVWKLRTPSSAGVRPRGSSPRSRCTARWTTTAASRQCPPNPALLCTLPRGALPPPWSLRTQGWTACENFKRRQMTFVLHSLKQTCRRRFKKLLSPPVSNPYQGLALNRFQLCRKFLAYASIFFYFVLFFERFCTFI